jgi:glycine/D-amino acid oxidase-like deaminating enzyme
MTTRSPDVVDVIIIGGGIIGGSIAWRMAQAGAAVTLVDAGAFGGEASWAGAGMLAPGGEFVTRSSWAEFALESLALYPEFVEELKRESGLGIDYRRCGAFEISRTEAEWQDMLARRAAQAKLGIRSEVAGDGLFYPDDALVDPRDVTRALRSACEKRGVRIRGDARAGRAGDWRAGGCRDQRRRAVGIGGGAGSGGLERGDSGVRAGRTDRDSGHVSGARAPAGICAGARLARPDSAAWAHVCDAAIQRIHHCGDFVGGGGLQPGTGPGDSG